MAATEILIVEDENLVAKDIQRGLESFGYVVSGVVTRGEEAVDAARTAEPNLILMDIVLRGKMDGIEAAARIRNTHDIPVVFLTAYGDDVSIQRAKTTEPYGYILKPFVERELQAVVKFALYKHRAKSKSDQSHQRMINDMRTYLHVGSRRLNFESVDCTSLLNQALDNLNAVIQESKAAITTSALPTLTVDAQHFILLFQNLIDNAIRYRSDRPLLVHLAAVLEDDYWKFSVCDNGIGIDADETERIFDVLRRLDTEPKKSGNGIGLAICRKIVERHRGRIWVESEPGEGSTFYFTVPAADG